VERDKRGKTEARIEEMREKAKAKRIW